jgi:hypothetical protein
VRSWVAAGLLFVGLAHPALAHESWSEWLIRIFGVGGTRTFVGYLPCAGKPVFPACLTNGTHFVVINGLTDVECVAYVNAARAAGGDGGSCL